MTTEYSLEDFCIDLKVLKNNKMFFIRNYPQILADYISKKGRLAVTGDVPNIAIAKSYFTISYGNRVLFHGKQEGKLLSIIFDITSIYPVDKPATVSPVVIYDEQYFTQKYEPCKYEKVFFKDGDKQEREIFNQDKPTHKKTDGTFKNKIFHVSAIVPPKNSKNTKELKIRLENVKTDDCSFLDINKAKTDFSEGSSTTR